MKAREIINQSKEDIDMQTPIAEVDKKISELGKLSNLVTGDLLETLNDEYLRLLSIKVAHKKGNK